MKRPNLRRARLAGGAAALLALALDQASKYWLLNIFDVGARQPVRLAPVFDLVLQWNQGISYSLLTTRSDSGRLLLLAGALAITTVLCLWLWSARSLGTTVALGLVIGGALGNAFDRWSRGAVADFFFFHVGSFRWYVFNVADCAIVIGVALLFWASWRSPSEPAGAP